MGLWTLLEGFLLLANAFAILNEDRFLAPRGWSFSEFSVGRTKSLKGQLIGCRISNKDCRMRCKCNWCLKRFFSHKINQHSWSLADRTVKNISF